MWGGFIDLESLHGRPQAEHFPRKENRFEFAYGRCSLHYILLQVKPKKIHLPYFICDSVVNTIHQLNIEIIWFGIQNDFTPILPDIKDNEMLLVVNYYGLLPESTLQALASQYNNNLILDLTHAWFHVPPATAWAFNSSRKFFGVPDGSILWSPNGFPENLLLERNTPEYRHLLERVMGKPDMAYQIYTQYESAISIQLKQQSELTSKILQFSDLNSVQEKRKQNYIQLHKALSEFNTLKLPESPTGIPFAYPLLLQKPIDRSLLHAKGLFIPLLWKEVITRIKIGFQWEKTLSESLLPIPLDQRYDSNQIDQILKLLISCLKH
jgi:hypothetical protein